MSWISALSTLMQLALTILKWTQQRQLLKAGEDAAVAKAALEILENTEAGKELRQKIRALDDDKSNQLWDDMLDA